MSCTAAQRCDAAAGAAAVLLLCAGAAAAVCQGSACDPSPLDAQVMDWFWHHRRPWLDAVLPVLTGLGSMWVIGPLAAAGAGLLLRLRRAAEAAFVVAAVFGASAAAHLTKFAVARPRPALHEVLGAMPVGPSFPSAHAVQVVAFAVAVYCLVSCRTSPRAWTVALPLTLVCTAVCASRIYLQVHYPSDVIAGALGGALWVATLAVLLPVRRY